MLAVFENPEDLTRFWICRTPKPAILTLLYNKKI